MENAWTEKIEKLEAEKAELLEALASMVGRFGGSGVCISDHEAIKKARAAIEAAERKEP